jgi:hypothetical protein
MGVTILTSAGTVLVQDCSQVPFTCLCLTARESVGYSQLDEVVDALETIGHEFKQQVFSSFKRIFPGIVIVPCLLRRQGLILVTLEKYFTVVRGTSSGR